MISGRINHLAVFVLVIVHQIFGFVWYSPYVFGNAWLTYVGKTSPQLNHNPIPYILSILSSLFLCYTIAILYRFLSIQTVLKGIIVAFVFWFSFLFLNTATQETFAVRPLRLILINTGGQLVLYLLTGAVLASWRGKAKR